MAWRDHRGTAFQAAARRRRGLAFSCLILWGLIIALPGAARGEFVQSGSDVFGTLATRSDNMRPFPKWTGVLQRYARDVRAPRESCSPGLFTECPVEDWLGFLNRIKSLSPEEKLREVNSFHNRARYIPDIVNWRIEDYWASPYQFLDKNGDCEDYAIAKFMSLRALGFTNAQMRIVVLRDLNLRVAHAILVADLGGNKYVLDNQIRDVVPAQDIHHYAPIYSVNETNWWLHRKG